MVCALSKLEPRTGINVPLGCRASMENILYSTYCRARDVKPVPEVGIETENLFKQKISRNS